MKKKVLTKCKKMSFRTNVRNLNNISLLAEKGFLAAHRNDKIVNSKKFSKESSEINVIITGVGGQGNVLASRVLAGMLVNAGFYVTIGETFGMSQRGGSVMSHLRISKKSIMSPQIPLGRADIIIALEPVEALRVLTKYGNPDVLVLANSRVVYPIGVITGELNYPSLEEIQNILKKTSARSWLVDATEAAVKLGNPILSNIIMIGALAATKLLPINREIFKKEIARSMAVDKRAINLAAFDAGAEMI
jgi:indolepyruvate ferredoxin oxidoreductase, beta subunit